MLRALILTALVVLALVGCSPDPAPVDPPQDANTDAQAETAATDETPATDESQTSSAAPVGDPIVIDVRTLGEWDAGHVSSAVHIPVDEIADRISEVTSDKNAKIVLYCKSGGRAGRAKTTLEELGFTNVENAGGYENIKDQFSE